MTNSFKSKTYSGIKGLSRGYTQPSMVLTPNTKLHSLGKFSSTSVVIMKRKIIQTSNHILLQDANKTDLNIYPIFKQFLLK